MPKLFVDHLAVAAQTLAQGAEYVQDILGVTLSDIGHHPLMGTHNRLFSLGPSIYFEIIAVDPDADPPSHPRWFDLDNFSGTPRINNWICSTDDFAAARNIAPGAGGPIKFERGPYRWSMAVPETGKLPFDGAFPALLDWHSDAIPAPNLPDQNYRLDSLLVKHPDIENLCQNLVAFDLPDNVTIAAAPQKSIHATIQTPSGPKEIS